MNIVNASQEGNLNSDFEQQVTLESIVEKSRFLCVRSLLGHDVASSFTVMGGAVNLILSELGENPGRVGSEEYAMLSGLSTSWGEVWNAINEVANTTDPDDASLESFANAILSFHRDYYARVMALEGNDINREDLGVLKSGFRTFQHYVISYLGDKGHDSLDEVMSFLERQVDGKRARDCDYGLKLEYSVSLIKEGGRQNLKELPREQYKNYLVPVAFKLALWNLYDNAMKYGRGKDGSVQVNISIIVDPYTNHLKLLFGDRGDGMNTAQLKVEGMKKGVQGITVDTSDEVLLDKMLSDGGISTGDSSIGRGAGGGLAAVTKFVEDFGGSIKIWTKRGKKRGNGTDIYIELPYKTEKSDSGRYLAVVKAT